MQPPFPDRYLNRRTLAITGLLCWAGAALIAWLALSGHMTAFDMSGLLFWRNPADLGPVGPSWLNTFMRTLSMFAGAPFQIGITLLAAMGLSCAGHQRPAPIFPALALGAWIANSAIKEWVGRPRPSIVPHLTEAGGFSLPSGHSFNAAAIYLAMALIFAAYEPRPAKRIAMIGGAIVLSLGIACSRVWLGVHYPSDVIVGLLGGAGLALFTVAGLSPMLERHPSLPQ